jgi:hypothetical protein
MASLPPDLDRLGDQLTRAAGDTLAARRLRTERRARVALAAAIGALAFGALTPADLGHAVRGLSGVPLVSATIPRGCEHLHGAGFMLPRCDAAQAAVPHRPYAWR